MDLPLYKARIYLYWFFLLWTILLFSLAVARLSYTENIPPGDPLNGGINFFDPSVVALLVSSLLGLIFAPFMLYTLYTEYIHRFLTLVAFELTAAAVLWIIWLSSTAAATNVWPNLSFCVQYRACTNLQAMIAFAYLGWICLTLIILITAVAAKRSHAWREHSHEAWSDRYLFGGKSRAPLGMPTSEIGSERPLGPQMRSTQEV